MRVKHLQITCTGSGMQFRHISQHHCSCPIVKLIHVVTMSYRKKKLWEHNFIPGNLESICRRWILLVAAWKHRQSWQIHYSCQRWKSDLYKKKKSYCCCTQIEARSRNFCFHQSNVLHVVHLNWPGARNAAVKFLKITKRPSHTLVIWPFSNSFGLEERVDSETCGVNHIPSRGLQREGLGWGG